MKQAAIAGYGAIGPIHAAAFENVKQARLSAVCDIDPVRRELCVKKYGTKAYADYDELLQDAQIDSVHICTPHDLHFEMTRKALEAGKTVVLEKPVTMSQKQFEQLAADPNADKVCVVLQNRLNRCVEKMKEILESGTLGAILGAKAVLTWQRDAAYYQSADWRGTREREGGGVLINQAIHTLDFFSYLLGGVRRVSACAANLSLQNTIEVEDTVCAKLLLNCGVTGMFFATNGYMENSPPYFEVVLEQGRLRYQDRELWLNGKRIETDEAALHGKAYWGSSHAALIRRYYDEESYFSIKDAADTMRTLFAIYRSAERNGEELQV